MKEVTKEWDWNKNSQAIWFTPCEESYYLINRWKEKDFKRFLDLGCGRGRHSIQFAKNGFDVSSVDLSDVAVSGLQEWAGKEGLNISAAIVDMMDLPFENETFDCLLAYHVISHTDSKGIIKAISEINRVLKTGGEFYITFCSKNSWSYKEAGFPRLDDNTVIKVEDGPENGVPHYHVDDSVLKELLANFGLITVKQIQDVVLEGHDYVSWHYFVLGKK
ncbi:MAG TPA: class I SAM-dependent methyltransferase [Clostridia bacterium]|nr:class I SAM-dependent methyltransferase [Clostridia bacterium]